MICHLCKNKSELRNSHIIPEFVYKMLYDDKHKFHVLSTQDKRPRPMEQKGIREKLLCGDCEQKLSVFEKYAREVILGGVEITVENKGNLTKISDINYQKFKLFQMSILWRASISSHQMFSRVSLGRHEEIIRKMIHEDDPGNQLDYPCLVYGLASDKGIQSNLIDQPRKLKIEGHTTYRFVFSGFMWSFYVSSHKFLPWYKEAVLSEAGEIVIGKGAFEELVDIQDFAVELHKMGRLNK